MSSGAGQELDTQDTHQIIDILVSPFQALGVQACALTLLEAARRGKLPYEEDARPSSMAASFYHDNEQFIPYAMSTKVLWARYGGGPAMRTRGDCATTLLLILTAQECYHNFNWTHTCMSAAIDLQLCVACTHA